MIKTCSAAAVNHRRRGSVLVLVMTLLGVLFVTGVAFLASMNFEAEQVAIERSRDRSTVGVEATLNESISWLREGLVGVGGSPFGGSLDEVLASKDLGVAPAMLGELPGVHDLFAPTEPIEDPPGSGEFRFISFTDLPSVMGTGDASFAQTLARRAAYGEVNVAWHSGAQIPGPTGPDRPIPVDSDGDGVTDTFQFSVTDLGFSKSQVAELSRTLNPDGGTGDPNGGAGDDVYLGMRVIAHGGMVNINESHPLLIINALGIDQSVVGYELTRGPLPGNLDFNHSPSTAGVKYSPELEEASIRRRVLLPPRLIPPSRLHGNALLERSVNGAAFGFADMPTKMFPTDTNSDPLESVFEGDHRYLPFTLEIDNGNYVDPFGSEVALWHARMEPFASFKADSTGNAYDRRHLVTTVSHDDLLSRGGRVKAFDPAGNVIGDLDLRATMIEVNRSIHNPAACPILPFEFADYPQDMTNSGCECPTDPDCRLNVRKGRLALSLAWLDKAISNGTIMRDQQQRIIHDAFMMLLRNARGVYWDEISCTTNTALCSDISERCDIADPDPGNWQCYDPVTGLSHREALISRTAASLTANLIDYMDVDGDANGDGIDDGIPTRVALRSFDFSKLDTVGRELGPLLDPTLPAPNRPEQYVYGLERQPYITEVTTASNNTASLQSWAVELYNPYPEDLVYRPGEDEYLLRQVDPNAPSGTPPLDVHLKKDIVGLGVPDGAFTVFRRESSSPNLTGLANVKGKTRVHDVTGLDFENGWIIYLVRRVKLPGESKQTDIVVDQFDLDSQYVGLAGLPPAVTDSGPGPYVFSLERFIPDPSPPSPAPPQSRWTATVPDTLELPVGVQTLGTWSVRGGPKPVPVEVNFANTGSFTGFDPAFNAAFPTTGSMLLLMRHANRPFTDRSIKTVTRGVPGGGPTTTTNEPKGLSFTFWLNRETKVMQGLNSVDIREREQIDNGRMPVFDEPVRECVNAGTPTGVRCRSDAVCGGAVCEQIAPAAHHADPQSVATNAPGGTKHLPWGQLLWDYFTVLPLSSQGPYPAWVDGNAPYAPAAADSIPRVDLDGLRAHGRININAAPWMVMGGLPLTPMQRIPAIFRDKVRAAINLLPADDATAQPISKEFAMAVVAYRDARELEAPFGGSTYKTGHFGDGPGGRGWGNAAPSARRGTGFITVGELANVRHPGAQDPIFRMDSGELDKAEPDYIKAIALLASLGDWVTVRSHVFTTYGTLRGEGDMDEFPDDPSTREDDIERADDVDKRAVRFQETVDRLPTFLGASKPSRIGQRYVGPYIDVRND